VFKSDFWKPFSLTALIGFCLAFVNVLVENMLKVIAIRRLC